MVSNILLREDRLVISDTLQRKVVKIAHEGHFGIVDTKTLLRSKVWLNNLDALVEDEIKDCVSKQ